MRRRHFMLAGVGVAGAFLVGCGDMSRGRLHGRVPLPVKDGQIALNGWVRLEPDGKVTVIAARSEMGQGVHTALMMLVAEELDCGFGNLRIEHSPIDKLYGNVAGLAEGHPFHPDDNGVMARTTRWTMLRMMRTLGLMMTGGSASIKDLWEPMREAAAMTRATVVNAVAASWQVPSAEVSLVDGVLAHASGKRMTLGEAVRTLGTTFRPAQNWTLKDSAKYRVIGTPVRRHDAEEKVSGSARFGIDVVHPDMLYAAVTMCPVLGGSVRSVDDSRAKAVPGVVAVVTVAPGKGGSGGVAVVADRYWRAHSALQALAVQWDEGAMAGVSNATIDAALTRALDEDDGFGFYKTGDVEAALKTAALRIDAEYRAPYLAHGTLEPMNCTVEFKEGRAKVWSATQVPGFARAAAARALDIDEEEVDVEVTYLGGGFGRRLEIDVVEQAAAIAKQVPGRPIQLLWSREEDIRHDFYRPACIARFSGGIDAKGQLIAWRNVSAGQAVTPAFLKRNAGIPSIGPDKTTSEGAFDQPYEFANARIGHATVTLPVPTGYWRAVGHSHQGFFKEGFIDECAHAAKADPLHFRVALLARHPRHRAVLQLAALKSGWGTPIARAADGVPVARGIALHESFGSIVAQVAEVSIAADQSIRVHRVVCVIDCGLPVNPNLIAQQMESAVVFGLSAALYGRIDIEGGRIRQGNFHEYNLLRLHEAPLVETHIVPSSRHPEGVGEPGLPPIAPAVANAVFVLSGQRLRSLPLTLSA